MKMKSSMSNRSFYQDVTSRAGSVAASWYTSAMSWFGDWIQPTQTISGRLDGLRVSESLIIELVQQGRILDDKKRQLEREAAAAGGLADYSWLVTEKPQLFDISDVDRLTLEQLCQQVTPEQCSRVIREFRSALLREPLSSELPNIMRAIVRRIVLEQNVNSCSSSPGVTEWLGRSLTDLKSRFIRSSPSNCVIEDFELSTNVLSSMELGSLDDNNV